MYFKMVHTNINVLDAEKSIKFYEEALGMKVVKTYEQPEGKFTLNYLNDGKSPCQIELTCLADRKEPYNHGDNDLHIAFVTDDFDAAYEKHKAMDCIAFENKDMGIYFIEDPDGYWLEIIPADK